MTKYFKFEYRVENRDKNIAEAYYVEKQDKDGSFYEMDETFSHFKIRMEFELGIKVGSGDWQKVQWRKEGEKDSDWKPFLVEGVGRGTHEEHGVFIYY